MTEEIDEINEYFKTRVNQMGQGYFILHNFPQYDDVSGDIWGIKVIIQNGIGNKYQSIFVLKDFRNQGRMLEYTDNDESNHPFITAPECNIEGWFRSNRIPYIVVPLTIED